MNRKIFYQRLLCENKHFLTPALPHFKPIVFSPIPILIPTWPHLSVLMKHLKSNLLHLIQFNAMETSGLHWPVFCPHVNKTSMPIDLKDSFSVYICLHHLFSLPVHSIRSWMPIKFSSQWEMKDLGCHQERHYLFPRSIKPSPYVTGQQFESNNNHEVDETCFHR